MQHISSILKHNEYYVQDYMVHCIGESISIYTKSDIERRKLIKSQVHRIYLELDKPARQFALRKYPLLKIMV